MSMLPTVIPPGMPRRGGKISRAIGRFFLRISGWKVEGEIPDQGRLVIAGAPHTSNWDFVVAVYVIMALGVRAVIFMKKEAFIWPFSYVWRYFGFIPTDRKAPKGVVAQVAEHFDSAEQLWVAVTPEGTRGKTERWKNGFLRIAHRAGVNVCLMSWDYPSKVLRFGPVIVPSGDHEKDLQEVIEYYRQFTGKRPHLQ